MGALVVLAILSLPVVEVLVFLHVVDVVGWLPALAALVVTSMAGGAILRLQGRGVSERARACLDRGEPPVAEAFDGLCLTLAGFLLALPGFVTDALALLLVLPPVRWLLRRWLAARMRAPGRVRVGVWTAGGPGAHRGPRGPIIEGEAVEVDAADVTERPLLPPSDDGQPRR